MTASGASTPPSAPPSGKIVLLGRPCHNTTIAQKVLQDAGLQLSAVILADSAATQLELVSVHDAVPVYTAPSPSVAGSYLEMLAPDLAIAACFPWRLSRRTRAWARRGVLNIHPSPLPHGRGPDPVFWVFRNGEREPGVTIHVMDEGLDSGPILAQQRKPVPEEMDAILLERHLFEIGARMAAALVPQYLTGDVAPSPQDALAATYQPAPAGHDWIVSTLLPASWAWRFVQGVARLRGPLTVQTEGRMRPVRQALSWAEHGDPPASLEREAFAVRFRPGWVVFR